MNGGGSLVTKSCPILGTPWTATCQAPLSMGFSRQEYWSGLPFPSPGDLPDPGVKPGSPALQALQRRTYSTYSNIFECSVETWCGNKKSKSSGKCKMLIMGKRSGPQNRVGRNKGGNEDQLSWIEVGYHHCYALFCLPGRDCAPQAALG